jgi:hypothetical protein
LNGGLQISSNKLTNRIAELEKVYAAKLTEERLRAESEQFTSVIELIEMYLTVHGFAPQPKESLAEATCRALGCDMAALETCIVENQFGTVLLRRFESNCK